MDLYLETIIKMQYGYNIVFTWSETGEGYFKYRDPHTEKDILMKDVKG